VRTHSEFGYCGEERKEDFRTTGREVYDEYTQQKKGCRKNEKYIIICVPTARLCTAAVKYNIIIQSIAVQPTYNGSRTTHCEAAAAAAESARKCQREYFSPAIK